MRMSKNTSVKTNITNTYQVIFVGQKKSAKKKNTIKIQ